MKNMIRPLCLAFALLLALSSLCIAQAEQAPQGMRVRSQMARFNVDRSALSETQIAAYEKALADYAAVEDQTLAALVAAGDVQQQDVQRFQRTRDTQGVMAGIEMDKWTDAQRQQYMDAMSAQGDERTSAFAKLVVDGLLTQAQADTMAAMNVFVGRRIEGGGVQAPQGEDHVFSGGPDGGGQPPQGEDNLDGRAPDGDQRQFANPDIWTQIMDMEQTESIQSALTTMQTAQQAFSQALSDAGVSFGS